VIYGARNPGLLIYKDGLNAWAKRDDVNLNVTVDKGDAGWKGREGFVPTVCKGGPVFSLAERDKLTKEY
jgi:sulfhydrogenase subunit gamma (sulfur reductase)